jgi:hypothetical protein
MTLLIKPSLLILCLIALLTPFTPSYALVVLQYHHVSESTPNSTSLSPDQFLEHMQLIEALQLEVVDLESATLLIAKLQSVAYVQEIDPG